MQENKNHGFLIAKKIENKLNTESTNIKEDEPTKDQEGLHNLLIEDLFLSDEENDATWTLNVPENIELDFPPLPELTKKTIFKIPNQNNKLRRSDNYRRRRPG